MSRISDERARHLLGKNASSSEIKNLSASLEAYNYYGTLTKSQRSGPHMWRTIHWIALSADEEERPDLYITLMSIISLLHPCKNICRPSLKENLQKYDPSKYTSMFEHSVDLHNAVNVKLGKSIMSMSDARYLYSHECKSCLISTDNK